jgi:SAM-dependent methyltransferase
MTDVSEPTSLVLHSNRLTAAANLCGYSDVNRYLSRAEFLFGGVDPRGKHVLDVGCGRGAWALWAGLNGASRVLGIEPEVAGSTSGSFAKFQEAIPKLGLASVVSAKAVDALELSTAPFDIIVLYNVINHFSEDRTRTLDRPESRLYYHNVFKHLALLLRSGGTIIIADCARRNFFGDLKVRNPLVPDIDWPLHRSPDDWFDIMKDVGFRWLDLRWSYLYPFTWLPMHRVLAYFTASHFVLRAKRVES